LRLESTEILSRLFELTDLISLYSQNEPVGFLFSFLLPPKERSPAKKPQSGVTVFSLVKQLKLKICNLGETKKKQYRRGLPSFVQEADLLSFQNIFKQNIFVSPPIHFFSLVFL
jgi:hypothetical protein